jgi:hypothetical protein
MLPALPTPTRDTGPLASWRRLAAALMLVMGLLLPLVLSSCGGVGQPPRGVLLDALGQQIQLTQGEIARALELEPGGLPQVSRVRVERQDAIRIGEGKGLRLAGRFDWRLPGDPIRVDSPFELYLQRGERGETWRLARPSGSTDGTIQDWFIYPLPLPG